MVKDIPIESVFCDALYSVGNVALPYNFLEPKLGDRVVNLTNLGTPFGFKGTVVTIHAKTKYVEVVFDQEFIGGKGLQGVCSAFRGRLCPWSDFLLVSRQNEYRDYKKNNATNIKIIGKDSKKPINIITPKAIFKKEDLVSVPNTLSKISIGKTNKSVDNIGQANLGQALLKILKKEEKPSNHNPSNENKVQALKSDMKEIEPISAIAIVESVTSNGSGVQILAQAAGYSISDVGSQHTLLPTTASMLSHNVLMGVISYQAKSTPLIKSSLTTAPSASVINVSNDKIESNVKQEGSSLILDKEATRRMVTRHIHSAPNMMTEKIVSTKQKSILKRISTDSNEASSTKQLKNNESIQILKQASSKQTNKESLSKQNKSTSVKEDVTISLASKLIQVLTKSDKAIIDKNESAISIQLNEESIKVKKSSEVLKDPPAQSLMTKLLNAKNAMKSKLNDESKIPQSNYVELITSETKLDTPSQSIKDKLANAKKLMKEKQSKSVNVEVHEKKIPDSSSTTIDLSTKDNNMEAIKPTTNTTTTFTPSLNQPSIVSLLIKAKSEAKAKAATVVETPPPSIQTFEKEQKTTSKEKSHNFLVPSKVIITKSKI